MINKYARLAAAKSLSDWELIQLILKGDEVLLEVLYDRYAQHIFAKCFGILKHQTTAQDLSHDIMIKVFSKLANFKGNSDFSAWVNAITYNACMNHLRVEKRLRFDDFEISVLEHISTDEIELEHKVLKELQFEQLEILFEELKDDDKMILLMRYQDGMSIKLIADTLKLGESAVKMRLKRSRTRLAQLLKQAQYEAESEYD